MTRDVVLLTGAGQIGLAIVRRIGSGKRIVVADRSMENAERTAKVLAEAGFESVPFKADTPPGTPWPP